MNETKFESDLKAYFPDIYKLHQLGKWDKWLWEVIYAMLEMADKNLFGEIRVTYQRGKINQIYQTAQKTSRIIQNDGFAVGTEGKQPPEFDSKDKVI